MVGWTLERQSILNEKQEELKETMPECFLIFSSWETNWETRAKYLPLGVLPLLEHFSENGLHWTGTGKKSLCVQNNMSLRTHIATFYELGPHLISSVSSVHLMFCLFINQPLAFPPAPETMV